MNKQGRPYKLKALKLRDGSCSTSVRCKLWGKHAEEDIKENQTYSFVNLEVNIDKSEEKDLNSTDLTKISEEEQEEVAEQECVEQIDGVNTR